MRRAKLKIKRFDLSDLWHPFLEDVFWTFVQNIYGSPAIIWANRGCRTAACREEGEKFEPGEGYFEGMATPGLPCFGRWGDGVVGRLVIQTLEVLF